MRILITNDDGINAPGLQVLEEIANTIAGPEGEVWTVADLEHYITDPNSYVEEKVGDKSLKTKMTFKMKKNQADVIAFLAQHSPDAGAAPAEAPAEATPPASN